MMSMMSKERDFKKNREWEKNQNAKNTAWWVSDIKEEKSKEIKENLKQEKNKNNKGTKELTDGKSAENATNEEGDKYLADRWYEVDKPKPRDNKEKEKINANKIKDMNGFTILGAEKLQAGDIIIADTTIKWENPIFRPKEGKKKYDCVNYPDKYAGGGVREDKMEELKKQHKWHEVDQKDIKNDNKDKEKNEENEPKKKDEKNKEQEKKLEEQRKKLEEQEKELNEKEKKLTEKEKKLEEKPKEKEPEKKEEKVVQTKPEVKPETEKKPEKKPFWKRVGNTLARPFKKIWQGAKFVGKSTVALTKSVAKTIRSPIGWTYSVIKNKSIKKWSKLRAADYKKYRTFNKKEVVTK